VKATRRSGEILNQEWADGMALCDAKKLLSHIRSTFQTRKLKTGLSESDIVEAMGGVPDEVVKVLKMLKSHTSTPSAIRKKGAVATAASSQVVGAPAKQKTGGANE
jgi:hypothetical protein